MARQKGKIKEIIESGEAPSVGGSKKKYLIDHRSIWNPKTNKALVTATEFENVGGKRRGVIETADTGLQRELEKRGYVAGENKMMHENRPVPFQTIKSADQVEKENK